MKNLKYLQKMFFLLVMGCSLSVVCACSDDDDDDDNGGGGGASGGGNINYCYSEVDGKRTDYKYAYYYEEYYEGELDEVELTFCTIDMMYYYQNPDKVERGIMFSEVDMEFYTIPTTGSCTEYDLEFHFNEDLYEATYDESDGGNHSENYVAYYMDWTQNATPISITRDGYFFKIEAKTVKMLETTDGISSDTDYRKTTANFYFEGTAANISDMSGVEASTRGVQAVKVDKEFMNWLKSLKNKR